MQYRDLTLYLFSVQRYKYVHLENMKTFISLQSGKCLVVPFVHASITFIQYFFILLVFTAKITCVRIFTCIVLNHYPLNLVGDPFWQDMSVIAFIRHNSCSFFH